jgi:hypothetical protein
MKLELLGSATPNAKAQSKNSWGGRDKPGHDRYKGGPG